jgi:hypothetical protein
LIRISQLTSKIGSDRKRMFAIGSIRRHRIRKANTFPEIVWILSQA